MDWMHGYYAHSGYSYGYYAETMPARLRWNAMLYKCIIPAHNFRYLDAGCGQGYNLVLAAAMHPDSEFVGIDFMPEHIAHARRLAALCKLDNVTFIEGDFTQLARDPAPLGEFDMVVCHGISTWIHADVKTALFQLVSAVLRPGGIFYNSYNTLPGWLAIAPFQHLVALEQRSGPGLAALNAARKKMTELKDASDRLFKNFPTLEPRLKSLESQDSSYLIQEYNNGHWKPVFVSEMMEAMSAVKLDYLGTASLSDAFDGLLKPEVRKLIHEQPDAILREQVRDYAIVQSFRRDLYVKGRTPTWEVELQEALRGVRVIASPIAKRPEPGEPFKLQNSTGDLLGNHEIYSRLFDTIAQHEDGVSIGELIDAEADQIKKGALLETVSMMIHGGWLSPCLTEPNPRGAEIVQVLTAEVCLGAPYRYVPLPRTGGAIRFNETELFITKLLGEGVPHDAIPARIFALLAKLGRKLAKDGEPINDEAEGKALLDERLTAFVETKVPFLRRVGYL